jgi:hypothetical protein
MLILFSWRVHLPHIMLTGTYSYADLDAPDVHLALHLFLETYILEHDQLIRASGVGCKDNLIAFYARLADALLLRFLFTECEDTEGDHFIAHLEVSNMILPIYVSVLTHWLSLAYVSGFVAALCRLIPLILKLLVIYGCRTWQSQ